MTYDVVIAGAGPAGSTCAAILGQKGLSVLLVEKEVFPREKVCGCCLNPGAWPVLEEIGADGSVRSASHMAIRGVRLLSWKGTYARRPLEDGHQDKFIAIRRSVLDTILADNAQQHGTIVLFGTKVADITVSEENRITLRSNDGIGEVRCRYVVGADGRNSVVATALAGKHRAARHSTRCAFQWFAKAQSSLGSDVLLVAFPYGYFGVVNVDNDLANVAMVVDIRRIKAEPALLPVMVEEEARRALVGHELHLELTPSSPILAASPVAGGMKSTTAFLAGDAAEIVEPFTGEGMMLAMLGGMRAAAAIMQAEGIHHRIPDLPIRRSFVHRFYPRIMANPARLSAMMSLMGRSRLAFEAGMRRVLG